MEIIMEQMDQDNIKNKKLDLIKSFIQEKIKEPIWKISIAMLMILIVIAILLIQGVSSSHNDTDILVLSNDDEAFVETKDEKLSNFVKGYLRARTYLDFVNIYRAFDKNYMLVKDTEESKRYDNGILYEKNYVSGYNNINIYEHKGLKEDEKVVLMTYDMTFYFSDTTAPSILMGYVVEDKDKIYFKDNYDIGETKYINALMERSEVKVLYRYIKDRLELALTNDSNLKLAYNSLRQYDINPNNDMLKDKDMLIGKVFGSDSTKEKELINLARKKEEADEEE